MVYNTENKIILLVLTTVIGFELHCVIFQSQVVQQRMDGSLDFYKGWVDYQFGFSNGTSEFWIGQNAFTRNESHN